MPQTFNVGSRSLFVTLTAWLCIAWSLGACAAAVVQYAQVASLMPQWQLEQAALPLVTGWLVGYLPWVMGAGAMLSVALVASAVGLLLRLEWARRAFIGLLAMVIVVTLAGLWLQHEVVQALMQATLHGVNLPPQVLGLFGGFATAAQAMAALVTLALCGFFAWVIRRLMSDSVRQEFA